MAHSKISPSSAGTWAPVNGCPGSVKMRQHFPEIGRSEAAERGTAAHEIAAAMIEGGAKAQAYIGRRPEFVGQQASNGVVIDDEIFDAAFFYVDWAVSLMQSKRVFGGPCLGIETYVMAANVHPQLFGTSDFHLYERDANLLTIADLKTGMGQVDPFENWQLISYAAGVLYKLRAESAITQRHGDYVRIRFVIVQPNGYHPDGPIREWVTDTTTLQPMFDQLRAGALLALSDNPPTRSGAHCRYCRARHACEAARVGGTQLYEAVGTAVPGDLTAAQLASQFATTERAFDHLSALKIGLEVQIKARARAGERIPGYRVEPTFGYEAWKLPTNQVLKMGEMYNKDLRKEDPITPKQARELGINESVIAAFSAKPHTGFKLVAWDADKHIRKVLSNV